MMVMVHVVPVQKVSCVAESAKPPGFSTPMSFVVLSEARVTWYRLPLYAPKRARTVLWAATHGVLPAAKMSQGPAPAVVLPPEPVFPPMPEVPAEPLVPPEPTRPPLAPPVVAPPVETVPPVAFVPPVLVIPPVAMLPPVASDP